MNFPIYVWLGNWRIHPHLLCESLAYTAAFRLLLFNSRQGTLKDSQKTSLIVGGMLGALAGAKLLVILQHIYLVWQDWRLWLLLLVRGKTVVGALLGGIIGVEFTKKQIGVTQSTGDAFVYPLILGTAIGRVGCFLTGLSDRTYGIATTLPWGVDFGDGIFRHPTQLYEIVFLLLLIFYLKFRSHYQIQVGDLFKFYVVSYLTFRFLIDFIKPDFHPILGMSVIQFACLFGIIYYRRSLIRLCKFSQKLDSSR
jgi:phosphatidylglycerol---prolipoprotein diacylglyceryl transferase